MDNELVEMRRVIGHTHPRATGPSGDDQRLIKILKQTRSWIYEIGGEIRGTKFGPK